jgi:hypothetical protein
VNKKDAVEQTRGNTYNQFKSFEGKKYTGMKVGGRHTWYYDKGEWKEQKVAPDRWEFTYAVPKRRAGHAPPGSGVPVGTEYHWYILAHQNVAKLDENTYSTAMTGLKFKVAHKRAGTDHWSASEEAQRRYLIGVFQEMIDVLSGKSEPPAEKERPTSRSVGRRIPEGRSRASGRNGAPAGSRGARGRGRASRAAP